MSGAAGAMNMNRPVLTLDYQFMQNPGYNADRGPISFSSVCLHVSSERPDCLVAFRNVNRAARDGGLLQKSRPSPQHVALELQRILKGTGHSALPQIARARRMFLAPLWARAAHVIHFGVILPLRNHRTADMQYACPGSGSGSAYDGRDR